MPDEEEMVEIVIHARVKKNLVEETRDQIQDFFRDFFDETDVQLGEITEAE